MATPEETYYEALRFAAEAHGEQKDLDGLPYILHPARVAEYFVLKGQWDLAIPAVLHDVIEDTKYDYLHIEEAFGKRVADIVALVSRWPGESYSNFINRVATDDDAAVIKLADIRDNLYRRGPVPSGMEKRYLKAIAALTRSVNV